MGLGLAFLAVCAIGTFLASQLRMPRINVISLFSLSWGIAVIVCLAGSLTPPMQDATWLMITVAMLALFTGAFIAWGTFHRQVPASDLKRHITIDRIEAAHVILSVLLLGFGLLQIYNMLPTITRLGGFGAVFSIGNGGELKYQQELVRSQAISGGIDSGSFVLGAVGYVLFLGNLSIFTGALLWRKGRPFLALLPLLLAAGYSLLSLQRTSFVMTLLLFLASVILLRYLPLELRFTGTSIPAALARTNRLIVSITTVSVVLVVLLVPLLLRNAGYSGNSTGFESLAQYLVSGLDGLNVRLVQNPQWIPPATTDPTGHGPVPGWGSYTFNSLFTLLTRFGLHVPRAPYELDFYSGSIFGVPYLTNTATALATFFFDFGWAGIVVLPFLIGFFGAWAQARVVRGSANAVPVAALFLVTSFWSFFVSPLLIDFRWWIVTAVAVLLLKRIAAHTAELDATVTQHARHRRPHDLQQSLLRADRVR